MPLILQVGLSKKIGQPNYGSLGASCNLGIELDQTLLATDLDSLQLRVRQAFAACRQAVQEELMQRAEQTTDPRTCRADRTTSAHSTNGSSTNEQHGEIPHDCHDIDVPPRASRKQLDYASQLSRKIHGLGLRRLETLTEKMFGKPLADLTHAEASSLIDVLKQIKEGLADLEAVLAGGADE
jgi:hypothetical protein